MKTIEKRQLRSRLGTVFADPYRKLAAVVLAVGLWFFLNDLIERDLAIPVQLLAVGSQRTPPLVNQLAVELPTNQVVGRRFLDADKPIDTAVVVFRGPRYRIDAIEKEVLDLIVKLQIDWSNRPSVEFTVSDLNRNLPLLRDLKIEIRPSRITLELEKIEDEKLPLVAELVELHVDDPDGLGKRLRLDTASFSPPTARILGPASAIEVFKSRAKGTKPLLARLKSTGTERQITTSLQLTTPPELGLRLEETPSMTIQVLPVTDLFELDVPLRIDDLALAPEFQGRYQPDPPVRSRVIRIRAGGQLRSHLTGLREHADKNRLRDWAREHLRLNVWIPPPEPGTPPPSTILREAVLVLQGPLRANVERNECELFQSEAFTLRREP